MISRLVKWYKVVKYLPRKFEKLSHHLNKDQRDKIKGALQGYYVLEFPEAIENSAGKQYKIVITNEKTAGDNLELAGGEAEEYPYELNSQPMAGNLCMIALYSNQMIFATMFKYMVAILTVLVSVLIILSGFGRLSVGKTLPYFCTGTCVCIQFSDSTILCTG